MKDRDCQREAPMNGGCNLAIDEFRPLDVNITDSNVIDLIAAQLFRGVPSKETADLDKSLICST